MPIDLSQVPWIFVGLMTALAFVAALLGSLISFRNRFVGAIIAAVCFSASASSAGIIIRTLRAADRQVHRWTVRHSGNHRSTPPAPRPPALHHGTFSPLTQRPELSVR